MRRTRWLILLIGLGILASTIRIEHHSLGWGGYWSLGFDLPWNR